MTFQNNPAQQLKTLLFNLLPPDKEYVFMVKKEAQENLLKSLDNNIPHESFYFVYSLLSGEFEQINGVEKWLGYSKNDFNVNRYLNAIHPGQAILHNMFARSMYKTLCSGKFKLQFSRQRYISHIGLRHYNGEYIIFKKTTSIFQYDQDNKLIAQLNEFTKLDAYESEPLKPRITEMDGLQKDDFERLVFQMTLKTFMEKKYFSETEFKILRIYADNEIIGTKGLAEELKVGKPTIDTLNKRILSKARQTFTHKFDDARGVALYLKKEKII